MYVSFHANNFFEPFAQYQKVIHVCARCFSSFCCTIFFFYKFTVANLEWKRFKKQHDIISFFNLKPDIEFFYWSQLNSTQLLGETKEQYIFVSHKAFAAERQGWSFCMYTRQPNYNKQILLENTAIPTFNNFLFELLSWAFLFWQVHEKALLYISNFLCISGAGRGSKS